MNDNNMTNYDMIYDMCVKQKELDERILQGREYDENGMECGLFTELAEVLEEVPSMWKHWKKNQQDNREKCLEELVDVYHMYLSLELHENHLLFGNIEDLAAVLDINWSGYSGHEEYEISWLVQRVMMRQTYHYLYVLTQKLGFTLDDVYTAYLEKNAVNHKRQEEGY